MVREAGAAAAAAEAAVGEGHGGAGLGGGMADAAGSAPLIEAAHACHDLLERRIFQT